MLLRSLGSGVSGLKNFQTDLDVIGNNISNVGTTGFKKGRINFEDTINQQLQGSTTNVNAVQIGLGSQTSSIDNITTGGVPESTGNPYDVAINGEGYFRVMNGTNPYYTRAGDFKLDTAGTGLVNSQGMALDIGGTTTPGASFNTVSSFTIDQAGNITGVDKTTGNSVQLGSINLFTFSNPNGLEKIGNSLYQVTQGSGNAQQMTAATGLGTQTQLQQNALEGSNVDLTDEMTNLITAERAYQANSKTITTADQILQTLVNLKQ
ncbi:flagellar hook-basal body complex protein [Sporolactobacillus shoreae]|uniref:Flagellar hook protein FlgE n=1 Tax=Sporolactobacillus shoreae TaxID=1465501 RepID=A0A4Z0GUQ6_9BACL|nr:flagellar hook-basal body complex protein [Sporolactobacillus shoreae]TGB00287.1 flagellar hook-basal body complex protein [Sporolactobacillus shoreae]